MDVFDFYNKWLTREHAGDGLGLESADYANFRKKNDHSFWWRSIADCLTYRQKQTIKSILHAKTLLGFPVPSGEKRFAIDYVDYILLHRPVFQLDDFDIESQEEIRRFLLNHFRCAYQNYIPWNVVFPGNIYAIFQQADAFHRRNITKRDGIYNYQGFKTRVPGFEYGVLVNHCGMDRVPADALEKIAGTSFVDCGAFIGDSCYALQRYRPATIFAVEPEEKNIAVLEENLKLNDMRNVNVIHAGVAAKPGEAFLHGEGIGAFLSEDDGGGTKVPLVSIDALKAQNAKHKIGLIKMDIEGAELAALEGAAKVLAEDKPVLSIALYHSGRDFFEIPKYVKKLNSSYTLAIVHTNPLTPLFEEYLVAY